MSHTTETMSPPESLAHPVDLLWSRRGGFCFVLEVNVHLFQEESKLQRFCSEKRPWEVWNNYKWKSIFKWKINYSWNVQFAGNGKKCFLGSSKKLYGQTKHFNEGNVIIRSSTTHTGILYPSFSSKHPELVIQVPKMQLAHRLKIYSRINSTVYMKSYLQLHSQADWACTVVAKAMHSPFVDVQCSQIPEYGVSQNSWLLDFASEMEQCVSTYFSLPIPLDSVPGHSTGKLQVLSSKSPSPTRRSKTCLTSYHSITGQSLFSPFSITSFKHKPPVWSLKKWMTSGGTKIASQAEASLLHLCLQFGLLIWNESCVKAFPTGLWEHTSTPAMSVLLQTTHGLMQCRTVQLQSPPGPHAEQAAQATHHMCCMPQAPHHMKLPLPPPSNMSNMNLTLLQPLAHEPSLLPPPQRESLPLLPHKHMSPCRYWCG